MAYETASATGVNDLLDKLGIFAAANGWAIDYSGARTNPGGASQGNGLNALAIRKGGLYFVFYHHTANPTTDNPAPRVYGYTYQGPWVASNGTDAQANRSNASATNNLVGPYQAYHFFTDPAQTYLHVALEVVAGRYAHFGCGTMQSTGSGSPIVYVHGTYWTYNATYINNATSNYHFYPFDAHVQQAGTTTGTQIRADSDGVVPRYFSLNNNETGTSWAWSGFRASSSKAYNFSQMQLRASSITGRTVLVPPIVTIARASSANRSLIGVPRDLRYLRIDNLPPGEVLTIGADNWRTFPVMRKNGSAGMENSANFGLAYRVVP